MPENMYLENRTKVVIPTGEVGKLQVTRAERKAIGRGNQNVVYVNGDSKSFNRPFHISELTVFKEPEPDFEYPDI